MLFDEILEELQLTHKGAPGAAGSGYAAQGAGSATLDQLDEATHSQYQCFLGFAWLGENDWVYVGGDKHARRARLASGDDSDYDGDTSSADIALACSLLREGFKHGDVETIMRATRYREKFDKMHGPTTYLTLTINKAIASVAEGIIVPPTALPSISLEQGRIRIPLTPPPPRNYVWHDRMVAGHAYALGGFGGVSKSQAALQLAASIALGKKFGNVATKKGSALLIFGEDDVNTPHGGTTMSESSFKGYWRTSMLAAMAAGSLTERFAENDLRAKVATEARDLGQNSTAMLGHSSDAVTKRHYHRGTKKVDPLHKTY